MAMRMASQLPSGHVRLTWFCAKLGAVTKQFELDCAATVSEESMTLNPPSPSQELMIEETATARDAIRALNEFGHGVVFVRDVKDRILGSISDGDVRRALVAGKDLDSSVLGWMNRNFFFFTEERNGEWPSESRIVFAPVLSKAGFLRQFEHRQETPLRKRTAPIVIMAGGFGKRLGELTKSVPKPMVKVQDKPLAEHLIMRALNAGYSHVIFVLHYMSDQIRAHFGDGTRYGAKFDYVIEPEPLGTAGGLRLLRDRIPTDQFVVVNSDILSDFDLGELLDFHVNQGASMTVSSRMHVIQNPFGVLEVDGGIVQGVIEKPTYETIVAAGAYVMDTQVIDLISPGKCDMPELVSACVENKKKVMEFRIHEAWLDVGRPSDLSAADDHMTTLKRGKL